MLKKLFWVFQGFLALAGAGCVSETGSKRTNYASEAANMNTLYMKADNTRPTVVYIPGVMGTELFSRADGQIWPPSLGSFRKDFSELYLDASGKPIRTDVKPGLPIELVYKKMYVYLEEQGYNVYYFGYDWRMDIAEISKKLEHFIDELHVDRVDIVAHSMGGLVSTQYIRTAKNPKVGKLITIGTPFLGAVGILKDLELGTFLGEGFTGWLSSSYFKTLLRNERSWYQLLPGKAFFEAVPGGYVTKTFSTGTDRAVIPSTTFASTDGFLRSRAYINRELLDSGTAFTDSLDALATLKKVDPYFIVGTGHSTAVRLNYTYSKTKKKETFEKVLLETSAEGDGTVLEVSATMGGRAEKHFPGHTFTFDEAHSLLLSNGGVLERVRIILAGESILQG